MSEQVGIGNRLALQGDVRGQQALLGSFAGKPTTVARVDRWIGARAGATKGRGDVGQLALLGSVLVGIVVLVVWTRLRALRTVQTITRPGDDPESVREPSIPPLPVPPLAAGRMTSTGDGALMTAPMRRSAGSSAPTPSLERACDRTCERHGGSPQRRNEPF